MWFKISQPISKTWTYFFLYFFITIKSIIIQSFRFIEADLTACVFHMSFVSFNKCWWKEDLRAIKSSSDITKTKCDCLAFLFELCFDLFLHVASNVSQTPVFEAFTEHRWLSLFVVCNLQLFWVLFYFIIDLFFPLLSLKYFN